MNVRALAIEKKYLFQYKVRGDPEGLAGGQQKIFQETICLHWKVGEKGNFTNFIFFSHYRLEINHLPKVQETLFKM